MNIIKTKLEGVLIIEPKVFRDVRGFFLESYNSVRYKEAGINLDFVQDNHSRSSYGIVRGLHFQKTKPQGKLLRVTRGEVYDVAVDFNVNSPTYGQYAGVIISEENNLQFYIPPGYAHGFSVLSDIADFHYKCTDFYNPQDEGGIAWNDPIIGIDWKVKDPILSQKDMNNSYLKDLNKFE